MMNKIACVVFMLSMSFEFAELIETGEFDGGTLLPIVAIIIYFALGYKPKKKQSRRKVVTAQHIVFDIKGNGWNR